MPRYMSEKYYPRATKKPKREALEVWSIERQYADLFLPCQRAPISWSDYLSVDSTEMNRMLAYADYLLQAKPEEKQRGSSVGDLEIPETIALNICMMTVYRRPSVNVQFPHPDYTFKLCDMLDALNLVYGHDGLMRMLRVCETIVDDCEAFFGQFAEAAEAEEYKDPAPDELRVQCLRKTKQWCLSIIVDARSVAKHLVENDSIIQIEAEKGHQYERNGRMWKAVLERDIYWLAPIEGGPERLPFQAVEGILDVIEE
jgi:hypothetical protein